AGVKVRVLEARDRVGGRVQTLRDPAFLCPVELGAEFVHGRPPHLWHLLDEAGAKVRRHRDRHVVRIDGELREESTVFDQVSEILVESGKADLPFQHFLDDPRTRARWPKAALKLAAMFVEGYYAAPLPRAGTAALRQMEQASTLVDALYLFRVTSGYDVLPRAMAERVDVRLKTPVEEIDWSGPHVFLRTPGREPLRADRAIITVPLSILALRPGQPNAIHFAPGLPEKRTATTRLLTGDIVKLALRFDEPFWERVQRGFSFAHGVGLEVPTWWTPRPFDVPVLVGWSGGPLATALSKLDDSHIVARGLASLGQLLGIPIGELERRLQMAVVRNWPKDPFALGGYMVIPAGALDAVEQLARPVGDKLFFAGEATSTTGFAGTVHGAIETGDRAAAEALHAMGRKPHFRVEV
ncbi:MAG: FAD-dependent oxidoreductase, partial [Myxococcaceae bacterium]|nr:FAD-dependent oxidoreductase [Myxococcaceae bacterium]